MGAPFLPSCRHLVKEFPEFLRTSRSPLPSRLCRADSVFFSQCRRNRPRSADRLSRLFWHCPFEGMEAAIRRLTQVSFEIQNQEGIVLKTVSTARLFWCRALQVLAYSQVRALHGYLCFGFSFSFLFRRTPFSPQLIVEGRPMSDFPGENTLPTGRQNVELCLLMSPDQLRNSSLLSSQTSPV